jgi:hypothetical protein
MRHASSGTGVSNIGGAEGHGDGLAEGLAWRTAESFAQEQHR